MAGLPRISTGHRREQILIGTFVVPAGGGAPKQLAADFAAALLPAWAPDSKHLFFRGHVKGGTNAYWVTGIDNEKPEEIGIRAELERQHLAAGNEAMVGVGTSMVSGETTQIVFPLVAGDSVNLWRARISNRTWRLVGPVERVTFGTAREQSASAAADGRLAFAALADNGEIWSLEADTDLARVKGELTRLTSDPAHDFGSSASFDGKKVAFASQRAGGTGIWVKDLASGKESPVTGELVNPSASPYLAISPDGEQVAGTTRGGLILGHVAGGAAEKICPGTFRPLSWSPDGKVLLVSAGVRQETFLCGPGTGALTPILRHSSVSVHSAQFSRDGRWIAFHVTTSPITRRLFVMRYEGAALRCTPACDAPGC
jgi:Tol biopolymer transport system component